MAKFNLTKVSECINVYLYPAKYDSFAISLPWLIAKLAYKLPVFQSKTLRLPILWHHWFSMKLPWRELQHTSRDKRAQAFCANFVLEATNTHEDKWSGEISWASECFSDTNLTTLIFLWKTAQKSTNTRIKMEISPRNSTLFTILFLAKGARGLDKTNY